MLTAIWPKDRVCSGAWTYSAIVAFDIADAIKLLNHVLARLDERATYGA
jgi:hypothetical protein